MLEINDKSIAEINKAISRMKNYSITELYDTESFGNSMIAVGDDVVEIVATSLLITRIAVLEFDDTEVKSNEQLVLESDIRYVPMSYVCNKFVERFPPEAKLSIAASMFLFVQCIKCIDEGDMPASHIRVINEKTGEPDIINNKDFSIEILQADMDEEQSGLLISVFPR